MKAITAKEWHLLIYWFPPGHAGEAGDRAGEAGDGAGEAGDGEAGAGEAGDGEAGEAGAGEVESSGRSGSEWSWGVYIAVTVVLLPCV